MSKNKKPQITFKYQKSPNYKNYHIDGVFGGFLPNTKIWFDIFFEKGNSPEQIVCNINNDGSITEVERTPTEKQNEIVRELQAGFSMDLQMAKTLRDWLDEKITKLEAEIDKINKIKK